MTTLTLKSIVSWSLLAVAAALVVSPVPFSFKLTSPILAGLALGSILHMHARRRGGWDQVSSLAVLGVGFLCLLVLATTAYWIVYFLTGFAD